LELSIIAVQSGQPFVGLVHGPKGSGKSTFSRTLMNTLILQYADFFTSRLQSAHKLSRSIPVAYLDCDLGQSEFSPPGLISLHLIQQAQFGEL
jgi:polynucleotide 5'-hydroxyl-kinase GRC3/NOL9